MERLTKVRVVLPLSVLQFDGVACRKVGDGLANAK